MRRFQELAGKELIEKEAYVQWLGRKHNKLLFGQEMTNDMAVFSLVLYWRAQQAVRGTQHKIATGKESLVAITTK